MQQLEAQFGDNDTPNDKTDIELPLETVPEGCDSAKEKFDSLGDKIARLNILNNFIDAVED